MNHNTMDQLSQLRYPLLFVKNGEELLTFKLSGAYSPSLDILVVYTMSVHRCLSSIISVRVAFGRR